MTDEDGRIVEQFNR